MFELGIGGGLSYLEEEGRTVPSVHIHATREVFGRLSFGMGYEKIFDEHSHDTVFAGVKHEGEGGFFVALMPGLSLNGEGLSLHLDIGKNFELGGFHAGPFVGVGVGKENHYTLGIHVGF